MQMAHSMPSPTSEMQALLKTRRAAATSAADMLGKQMRGTCVLDELLGEVPNGTNAGWAARAAAAMKPATSGRPCCLWYHTGSGSRGSDGDGFAPAANSAPATAQSAASCRGVRERRPLCGLRGSAPPARSTCTAVKLPEAAAAWRGVVALPPPCAERLARALGEEASGNKRTISSISPRHAATSKATSSSFVDTMPPA